MRTPSSAPTTRRPAILFVSISGWLGGPGRSLVTLLANLPDGVDRVLASPEAGDLLPLVRERGLIESHVVIPRYQGRLRPKEVARVVAIARIARCIMANRGRLSAVHANGFTELHLAAPGAALAGVPLVTWFHGYEARRWDYVLGPIWRAIVRRRSLVAVSQTAENVACRTRVANPHEFLVIPNPIDPRDLACLPSRGTPGGPLNVGYLGSLNRAKGFHLLPEIIGRLRDYPINWLIFRDAAALPATTKHEWSRLSETMDDARSHVSFVGRETDVRRAYQACDAVICPSLQESFGRIAAEAMLSGIPVVASDIEPFRDLLSEAGILFPPGDTRAASAAIARLCSDSELRNRLGRVGRAQTDRFDAGTIAERFATLYLGTTGSPERPGQPRR